VVIQIAGNDKFAPVQCGVTETVDSVFGDDLQRDEITSRAAEDHFGVDNSYRSFLGSGPATFGNCSIMRVYVNNSKAAVR
jgi:hypothetical protein